jgi:hypothetical protein
LEGPHAGAVDHGCLLFIAVQRFPIHLGVGIRIPDGEKYGMLLVVIDWCLRRRAGSHRAGAHGLERADAAEVYLLGSDACRHRSDGQPEQPAVQNPATKHLTAHIRHRALVSYQAGRGRPKHSSNGHSRKINGERDDSVSRAAVCR